MNAVSNLEYRCPLLDLEGVRGAMARVDQRVVREVAAVVMKSTVAEGIGPINGKELKTTVSLDIRLITGNNKNPHSEKECKRNWTI